MLFALRVAAQTQSSVTDYHGSDILETQFTADETAFVDWFVHNDPLADMIRTTDSTNLGAPLNLYLDLPFTVDHVHGIFKLDATKISYLDLANRPALSTVSTTGVYSDLSGKPALFSGVYSDLTSKPSLFSGAYTDLTGKPSLATVAISGAYNDLTGKPSLATVATTGAYSDLTGKPSLATVATTGVYADLTGKPSFTPTVAYAAGTAYTLTTTSSAVAFGTTSPTITLPASGTYMIWPTAKINYVGATFLSSRTITMKLRRTNNTAADVANSSTASQTQVVTLLSFTLGTPAIPVVAYTGSAGDVISMFAGIDVAPTVGSVQVTEASLVAVQLQ